MPEIPHSAEGLLIEPPVSDPIAPSTIPDATAAPEPDDEPPVWHSVFHGLRAGGWNRSNDGPPMANSQVPSLPVITQPACFSLATVVASSVGTRCCINRECPVVVTPA